MQVMRKFFAANINGAGRIVRLILGLLLMAAGGELIGSYRWPGILVLIAGLFGVYEAARGWCLMRACGIKTKL